MSHPFEGQPEHERAPDAPKIEGAESVGRKAVTTRINDLLTKTDKYWSDVATDAVLEHFPNEKVYTSAAGISPSGVVHFGNFRDVMTSLAVHETLKERGRPARFLFSWDDFDRFRKVPVGVDPSFEQYIGMPLTSVPDPKGEYPSYAQRFETDFMASMKQCGIEMDFKYQTEEYKSGRYDDAIVHSMQQREKIAATLLSFMSGKAKNEKGIEEKEYTENYFPISVYSRFTGKDNTRVVGYDGGSIIRYKCLDTGREDEVDFREEHIVKLAWKVDWPMRWAAEGVVFEPGGHDHASPGGSYDTSLELSREIFKREGPVFIGYEFIGLRGLAGKMSGSKGQSMSPDQLLKIFEPELLKWLYLRRSPGQKFELAFDSETIRQYSEFDKSVQGFDGLNAGERKAVSLSLGNTSTPEQQNAIPFRQAAALGQIVQWNLQRLSELLSHTDMKYSDESLQSRIPRAQHWMEEYNPEELFALGEEVNAPYVEQMDEAAKTQIRALREALLAQPDATLPELEALSYGVAKDLALDESENKKRQRMFFEHVNQLLGGREKGPRLGTFLFVADREKILKLLDI